MRKNRDAALPTLDLNALVETPNIAIVFDPPLEVPGRRTLKNFIFHIGSFVTRRLLVIAARIDDLEQAITLFEKLKLLREPTTADLVELEPTPDKKRQARRQTIAAWIAIIFFTVGMPVLWLVMTD